MTKRTLKEELERFNNIGSYVDGLSEQFFANMGSGFKERQEGSPRAQEFMEQNEDALDLEVSDDDLNLDIADEELGDEELGDEELGGEELGDEDLDLDLADE